MNSTCKERSAWRAAIASLSAASSLGVCAQTYTVDWDCVAVGGGASGNGIYEVSDTLGQPIVGASTADSYVLDDGFWSGSSVGPVAAQAELIVTANLTGKIRAVSLLAAATQPDGEVITITEVSQFSSAGGVVDLQNGWVLYQPPIGSSPQGDTFTYTVRDAEGNEAIGSVVVQLAGAFPGQPRTIVSVRVDPDGSLWIKFVGIAGRTYSVQSATDLTSPAWQTLTSLPAGGDGLFEFHDTNPLAGAEYYRAVTY